MHLFNISTSKRAPDLACFGPFGFETRFAPQARALFPHLSTQKRSEPEVFLLLAFECASRHSRVQFLIPRPTRCLRTRRFSEPTFRPPTGQNALGNHSVLQLFYLFARLHLLSSGSSLFSDRLSSSYLFSDSCLPTSFSPSVHTVGSFMSRLPSMIARYHGTAPKGMLSFPGPCSAASS